MGWGHRDYGRNPLPRHADPGTNYTVLLQGKINLGINAKIVTVRAPIICIIDTDCEFSISQARREDVEILVWVWAGRSIHESLRPTRGGHLIFPLNSTSIEGIKDIHARCRREVSIADAEVLSTFPPLRALMEAEIKRGIAPVAPAADARFALALAWMRNNLSIHAPVPALCDYLGMSRRTLHRFFITATGSSPALYFRALKLQEAGRLIKSEGWQLKAAAYHLGYSHPNDLSRALSRANPKS